MVEQGSRLPELELYKQFSSTPTRELVRRCNELRTQLGTAFRPRPNLSKINPRWRHEVGAKNLEMALDR